MATNDEIQRLIVQVEGRQRVEELTAEIRRQETTLLSLMANEGKHAPIVLAEAAALQRLTQELKAAERAAGISGGGMKNMGQAALEASRGLEDLQYGLGGVVNNIPSLVMAFGGGAGLTAAISIAAVSINQLVKHWGDLSRLFEETTQIPRAAGDIKGLKDELEKARERMEALGKQSGVTAAELTEYNALRAKTAAIEKNIADEQQRQEDLKKLKELKPAGEEELQKERAEFLAGNIGGKQEAIATALAEQLAAEERARLFARQKSEQGNLAAAPAGPVREEARRRLADINKQLEANASDEGFAKTKEGAYRDILSPAVKGDADAIRRVNEVMGRAPDRFRQDDRDLFAAATPEAMAAEEASEAEFERRNERAKTAREKRTKATKEAAKDQAEEDKEREQIERDAAGAAQAQAEAIAAAAKEREKADKEAREKAEKATKEGAKVFGKFGLDAFARAKTAELIDQGGVMDEEGQLDPKSAVALRRMIQAEIHRINPGVGFEEGNDVARAIGDKAQGDVMTGVMSAVAGGMGQSEALNTTFLQAVGEFQQTMGMLTNRLQRLEAQIGRARGHNAALQRQIDPIGQPNINGGGR